MESLADEPGARRACRGRLKCDAKLAASFWQRVDANEFDAKSRSHWEIGEPGGRCWEGGENRDESDAREIGQPLGWRDFLFYRGFPFSS